MAIKKWNDLIGNTPLVKLDRLSPENNFNLFAKLESFNLGGSIKDRPSTYIIEKGIQDGTITSGSTIIESSSGNMGIGLAQICLRHKLAFIAVVDPHTTQANINIMKALGARIVLVAWRGETTGSYLEARLLKVQELLHEISGSFWSNQYSNEDAPKSHEETIGEIEEELNHIDYLFVATGTCGTIRGYSDYLHRLDRKTKIIAVDADGSVIFGGISKNRLVPGHGSSIRSNLYRDNMTDNVVYVDDAEAIIGCHKLLREEALFMGGSSGAVVSAFLKFQHKIPADSNVVLVFCDRGERYLDTVYNLDWVNKNFPDLTKKLYDK